jgi:hypothetical protein
MIAVIMNSVLLTVFAGFLTTGRHTGCRAAMALKTGLCEQKAARQQPARPGVRPACILARIRKLLNLCSGSQFTQAAYYYLVQNVEE